MQRAQLASRVLSSLFVLGLLGCDVIDAPTDPVTGAPMLWPEGQQGGVNVTSAALSASGSCAEVEDQLRQMVIREMVSTLQASFASSLASREHCRPSWLFAGGEVAMEAMPAPKTSGDSSASSTPAHSGTNNQVAGVDEADLVKTDGNFLYHVGRGALRVFRSWPAAQTQLIARVELEGSPKKLFVHGDRALVYASLDGGASSSKNPYDRYGGDCSYGYDCVPMGDGYATRISVFDLTNRSAPRLVRELEISSSLLAARRIGRAIHTVVTTSPRRPVYSSYPDGVDVCDMTRVDLYSAFRGLLLENLARLRSAVLSLERPTLRDRVHGASGPSENPSPFGDCRGFLRSSLGDGGQMTSVISIAIDDERPAEAATIVSKPGVVYAAESALYLAEPRIRSNWGWFEALPGESDVTTIHKFALRNASARASYLASGLIKGRVLNQFALDEQKGFLRIATTTGRSGSSMVNTLTVLTERDGALQPVGVADGIGRGEDIRSVRFDGDRGYLVTFKKTDPLFVLDLADPAAPRVLAELKIPGFSTYMHRMDANHLLTIGYDGDDQGTFAWFSGIALQIFDVADPTQPKLKWKHVIGTRGSSSEALTNHLAFTYYAEKNVLALPITTCEGGHGGSYGETMTFSGLQVFDVTTAKGFALSGKIPFPPGPNASCSSWWTDSSSVVQRSLVIEDVVFALSDDRLKADALGSLGAGLVDLPLD